MPRAPCAEVWYKQKGGQETNVMLTADFDVIMEMAEGKKTREAGKLRTQIRTALKKAAQKEQRRG